MLSANQLIELSLKKGGYDPDPMNTTYIAQALLKENRYALTMIPCDSVMLERLFEGEVPVVDKVDPNASRDSKEFPTLLFYAVACNRADVVRLLLDHGADPHDKRVINQCAQTPLSYAVIKGFESVVQVISFHKRYSYELNSGLAVVEAMKNNRPEYLPLLFEKHRGEAIKRYPVTHWRYGDKKTAMYYAIERNDRRSVKLLLAHGGEADYPLREAIENGDADLVKALLDAGVSPNLDYSADDKQLPTPLFVAIKKRNVSIVQHLVNAGADLHYAIRNGVTAAKMAQNNRDLESLKLLLKHGAKGDLSLVQEIFEGNWEIVELMLLNGVDVNEHNPRYSPSSPLACAVSKKNMALLNRLIQAGAKIDDSAMAHALQHKDLEYVRRLHQHGAKITAGLLKACHDGNQALVDLMLDSGTDPNEFEPFYDPPLPLCYAVLANDLELVTRMLGAGADPRRRFTFQNVPHTPLSFALLYHKEDLSILKLLLYYGANPNDSQGGKTPSPLMQAVNTPAIFELLVALGQFTFDESCVEVVEACIAAKQPLLARMLLERHDPALGVVLKPSTLEKLKALETAPVSATYHLLHKGASIQANDAQDVNPPLSSKKTMDPRG